MENKKKKKYRGFCRFSFLRRSSILIGRYIKSLVYQVHVTLARESAATVKSQNRELNFRIGIAQDLKALDRMRVGWAASESASVFCTLNPRMFSQCTMRLVSPQKDRTRIEEPSLSLSLVCENSVRQLGCPFYFFVSR